MGFGSFKNLFSKLEKSGRIRREFSHQIRFKIVRQYGLKSVIKIYDLEVFFVCLVRFFLIEFLVVYSQLFKMFFSGRFSLQIACYIKLFCGEWKDFFVKSFRFEKKEKAFF